MSVPTRPAGALIDIAASCPPVAIDALLDPGGLLVIAPHPDDETLGCGAALAAALARGVPVTVALLTAGEGSHPASRRYPPEALRALRRAEFTAALAALSAAAGGAVPAVLELDLADTNVAAGIARAVTSLSAIEGVGTIWCTFRHDPHCDHAAAAAIAGEVAARGRATLFEYAVWGRFGDAGAGLDRSGVRPFGPGRWAPAKRAAMDCYRSQLTPMIDDDPAGFVMPPALTEHFATAPEIFLAPR
ncbi:PIG-L deacetylase family protein [Acuticoccus sp. I52.16.1]|uniref:PIG-L deacetylase family protein n=1 Tax=Acuticoccus sp. I52.16.1 TaxID=2928472 RepID=UPI001FD10AE0|nr:PIG-L family deacetylase [Acuticoccus sp. I52.16.1]UOM36542.1 PIG-L family deacetylase [Acuticoccus sp. I52.16.1]